MTQFQKIPATVITGFLGAGKTSLIQHLLANANGKRIALVINEFGDLGVDREILLGCGIEGCEDGDVVELANGCICCTVADDFLPTMEMLLARSPQPDHIVIETSGLALPKPLVKAFTWPQVRSRLTVDGVVAVVDAEATLAGRFAHDPDAVAEIRAADPALDHDSPLEELFEEQLGCADLVILNKTDLLDSEAAVAQVNKILAAHLRPAVKIVATAFGRLDPVVLLGLDAGAEDDLDSRHSHHDDDGVHDHDDFASFRVKRDAVGDVAAFTKTLARVAKAHDIYRMKGFVSVPGKAMRHVIQGVGGRLQGYFDRPWRDDEPRRSEIVVIGAKEMDRQAITAALQA